MSAVISTQFKSNASGRSQILAKGNGKQKTTNVDLSKSNDWNHGNAAGELALKLGLEWSDYVTHVEAPDSMHVFTF